MGKPRIIIADEDYSYIIPLQLKFIENMFDQIDLEIITDIDYFNGLFSSPQAVDVLIVSESFYSERLLKHDIKCRFVMKESSENEFEGSNYTAIYKYTNIKEIYSVIQGKMKGLSLELGDSSNESKLIVVTSATGGVGKTSIAMGIAATLSKHLKKVLYVNIDYLQSFQMYLSNGLPISDNQIYMKLSNGESDSFSLLRHLIRREEFDYLPPYKGALLSLGISHSVNIELAEQALASKEYDYVIVDCDSTFDEDKMRLLTNANNLIFVVEQTDSSVYALNNFLDNTDIKDKEKLLFVCNKFIQGKRNALVEETGKLRFFVSEYVEYMDDYWEKIKNKFSSNEDIQKIAMTIM